MASSSMRRVIDSIRTGGIDESVPHRAGRGRAAWDCHLRPRCAPMGLALAVEKIMSDVSRLYDRLVDALREIDNGPPSYLPNDEVASWAGQIAAEALGEVKDWPTHSGGADTALRICARYLANRNAGRTDGFNEACRAVEAYFGVPSVSAVAPDPACQHDLQKPGVTMVVESAYAAHCTVCKQRWDCTPRPADKLASMGVEVHRHD